MYQAITITHGSGGPLAAFIKEEIYSFAAMRQSSPRTGSISGRMGH